MFEVHATAAVVAVDLTGLVLTRVRPVFESSLADAAEDLVEVVFPDEEGVARGSDLAVDLEWKSSETPLPSATTRKGPKCVGAIEGETYEYTEMYPGFARTARDEGFEEIAEWLETLARAETSHTGRFTTGLESVK